MREANHEIEAFYSGAGTWRQELGALRAILLGCPVTEDFKWRSPCYTFRKGNVATVWGLKEACAIAFFKGVLLKDRENVLLAPGENSRSMRMIKFTSVAEITAMETVLRAYIHEAIDVEKTGLKVAFPKDDLDLPEELTEKLDGDPALKAAFESLTPGRRRGYILHFSRAKQSRTRMSRIDKSVPRILEGKGLHDR